MAEKAFITVSEGSRGQIPWNIEGDLSGGISLNQLLQVEKQVKIGVAEEVLAEEKAKGFDPDPRVRVDNKFDKPVDSVLPFGKIEYFARGSTFEIVLQVYEELLLRAPVDTGTYRNSNWVFYNGKLIARTKRDLVAFFRKTTINDNDKIRFVNLTPYARKLETRGVRRATRGSQAGQNSRSSRRTRSKNARLKRLGVVKFIKAPNGAYYLTYRLIRSKFKATFAKFSFQYISGGEAGLANAVPLANPRGGLFRTVFKGKGRGQGRPYLYPSLVLEFASKGILK